MTARTARSLALAAFLVYALAGGGRIVGSDEVTMLEVARALLAGRVEVPEGATLAGPDGRFYSKNAAGQAVAALPLVALAEAAARAAPLAPERRDLAVRFGTSFFNAAVTAILLGVFYWGARRLAVGPRAAMAAALLLGFTTPLWPYSKSFMADPLQALGLLMAALGAAFAGGASPPRWAGVLAGAGVFVSVSVKLAMLPLALACLAPLLADRPSPWLAPLAGLALTLAGHLAYNVARFGTPFETGYGAQASASAFTTPLLVGLYGLLLSSGKGALWFLPAVALLPSGWAALRRGTRAPGTLADRLGLANPRGRAAWSVALASVAGLLLYARFQHWAADGSFGPRYLVPLVPLAFLAVGCALDRPAGPRAASVRPPVRARWALLLGALGLLVQLGGVSIYFGAQMREAGDYPYTLALEDPRFMSDSHFNPAFSPIAGHWRMLARNLGEHLRGEHPRLGAAGGPGAGRLGLSAGDERALLHALDFWWLYLIYAGFPAGAVAAAALGLAAFAAVAALRAARAFRAEERAA